MKTALFVIVILLAMTGVTLMTVHHLDHLAEARETNRLLSLREDHPAVYDPAMVADQPAPVQRFFNAVLTPGAPLSRVVDLNMTGELRLGDSADPRPVPMTARQVLAPPRGFIWIMSGTMNGLPVTGSDSQDWTRFWIAGLIPVARTGSTPDHDRSAYARQVIEAAPWCPTALLPGPGITWEALDDDHIRVTVTQEALTQTVTLTLTPEGLPEEIVTQRWSNENPDKAYRAQPFGGRMSEFKRFDGVLIGTHVDVGHFYGTPDFFPFFEADITSARFTDHG